MPPAIGVVAASTRAPQRPQKLLGCAGAPQAGQFTDWFIDSLIH